MKKAIVVILSIIMLCTSIISVYGETESTKVGAIGSTDITYVGNWFTAGETMRSSVKDEYCEYTFTGTGIDVWFGRGAGAGIAEIFIDTVSMGKVDMYKASAATELMYSKTDLEYGEHTIKIVNTGEKTGNNTNVNLAYMLVYVPSELKAFEQVPAKDASIIYDGNWSLAGETMRSSAGDEFCEYVFAGKGIEIYFGMGPGAGIGEVFIDGVSKGTVDAYSATPKTSKLFAISDLTEGVHTVKLVNTGEKNDASSSYNVNLAYFNIELCDTVFVLNSTDGTFNSDGSTDFVVRMGGSVATVDGVSVGETDLVLDTDYAVTELDVTIKASFLATLDAGEYTLTIATSKGDASATLVIAAADTGNENEDDSSNDEEDGSSNNGDEGNEDNNQNTDNGTTETPPTTGDVSVPVAGMLIALTAAVLLFRRKNKYAVSEK